MNPSPSPVPFNSAHVQATMLKVLLVAGAVATGLTLLAEALSLAFPPLTDEEEIGNPIAAAVVLLVLPVAVLNVILYIATAVFFLVWLYRAHTNLRSFNPWVHPDQTSGWAVGSFFIPFVNFVVPYRAVRDVWRKSAPADENFLSEPDPPASFPLWWMFWLVASFAGRISNKVSFSENFPESTTATVSIIASALAIAAAIFAYLVVDAIDKRQEETAAKLKLGKSSLPPPPLPMGSITTAG